ncbi:MAG: adenylate/guanylate cyclase domain-containing protein [Leptolyngbyaceae bacterium]|nr:adenylate/guanylate cyclase domain-containing protein [Leptolyngbyaceae bacterium]
MTASSPFPSKQESPNVNASETVVDIDVVAVESDALVPDVVPSIFEEQKEVVPQSSTTRVDVSVDSSQVIDVDVNSSSQTVMVTVTSGDGESDIPGADFSGPDLAKPRPEPSASPTSGGALATTGGNFSAYLAPLSKDKFAEVVREVEDRLKVVNNTLSMMDSLGDSEGFEAILNEMLQSISLKTGELLNADRTTIYLLDEDKNELWSVLAKDENGNSLELRFPADKGIAGECATNREVIRIPYDFYDDPRAAFAKKTDEKNHYRTYTMLVLPLLDENDESKLVAVVQLINKLKPDFTPHAPLAERINLSGFTAADEEVFEQFAPSIRLILESSRSFYKASQRQRAADALMQATTALSQSSLDLEETLKQVMDQAKALMNADRSTLWLLDDEQEKLWTQIPINGVLTKIEIPWHAGFAGQVAHSKEPVIIPFDLYNHPNAETAKETDSKTGYRTCSMLCMPVFDSNNDLIGVTQLINKKRKGDYPAYDPAIWPDAPECWKASFDQLDQEFMQVFNIQAGVALRNAKLFNRVKQQEKMQRDILRSLSNAVISTDKQGRIIAANESAQKLLNQDDLTIEGRLITDLIQLKDKEFIECFNRALTGTDKQDREQYYPEQTLLTLAPGTKSVEESNEEAQPTSSVHLSINSITDVEKPDVISGVLVVMDDISDEKRLKSTMYRYMSQEVADQMIAGGDAKLGGDRKQVSVLFSDIRSFTTISEEMEAEELVEMLNEYFERMVDAVFQNKGTLDKYIGDAIMAVFGSPLFLEDHAWKAVQTSIEMRHRLADFNIKRGDLGKRQISIGIGINSGDVISGNIGSTKRMEFTAIGDGVNLGARLEGTTKQYGCDIIISENTYGPCKQQVWVRDLDCIRVKGKNKPVTIYELVGLRTEIVPDPVKRKIELYRDGRKCYLERKFSKAMSKFGEILEDIDNHDKAAQIQLSRCQHWLQNPPDDDWDGVWSLKEK